MPTKSSKRNNSSQYESLPFSKTAGFFFLPCTHRIGLEVMILKRCRALLLLLLLTILGLLLAFSNQRSAVTAAASQRPPCIALTFDDGPSPQTTAALLDGLRERGAHATFFLIGEQIAGNEALVARMKAEGHQVGNHSFTHVRLDAADTAALSEIKQTDDALRSLLGSGEYWIRPPWGFSSNALEQSVSVPLIFWAVDTMDWSVRNCSLVAHCIVQNAHDGDIVLLHDPYQTSVDAALQAIDTLSAQGYEFVTLKELFSRFGITPEAGRFYLRADQEVNW